MFFSSQQPQQTHKLYEVKCDSDLEKLWKDPPASILERIQACINRNAQYLDDAGRISRLSVQTFQLWFVAKAVNQPKATVLITDNHQGHRKKLQRLIRESKILEQYEITITMAKNDDVIWLLGGPSEKVSGPKASGAAYSPKDFIAPLKFDSGPYSGTRVRSKDFLNRKATISGTILLEDTETGQKSVGLLTVAHPFIASEDLDSVTDQTNFTATLSTISNLGLSYTNQGKLAEAVTMFQQELEGFKTVFGPDHASTVMEEDGESPQVALKNSSIMPLCTIEDEDLDEDLDDEHEDGWEYNQETDVIEQRTRYLSRSSEFYSEPNSIFNSANLSRPTDEHCHFSLVELYPFAGPFPSPFQISFMKAYKSMDLAIVDTAMTGSSAIVTNSVRVSDFNDISGLQSIQNDSIELCTVEVGDSGSWVITRIGLSFRVVGTVVAQCRYLNLVHVLPILDIFAEIETLRGCKVSLPTIEDVQTLRPPRLQDGPLQAYLNRNESNASDVPVLPSKYSTKAGFSVVSKERPVSQSHTDVVTESRPNELHWSSSTPVTTDLKTHNYLSLQPADCLRHMRRRSHRSSSVQDVGSAAAELTTEDARRSLALRDAIRRNDYDEITTLLDQVVDLDIQWSGYNPLQLAITQSSLLLVQLFLERGVDVNLAMKGGPTPLQIAAGQKSEDTIELLTSKGADIDSTPEFKQTPLQIAFHAWRSQNITKLLLDGGADMKTGMDENVTPRQLAALTGQLEVMELLLSRGADANTGSNDSQNLLLMTIHMGWPEGVQLLLSWGASVNGRPGALSKPLELAINLNFWIITKLLLKRGALFISTVTTENFLTTRCSHQR
ncbi:MAG: hypothetical protein M1814_004008 [Vezdaea aestivalis]|nr:MAG: hypothetical protein M1814_004008 [Vezdaea aestivalis]